MKKYGILILLAFTIIACNSDETPVDATGSVSFIVNESGLGAGRVSNVTPEKLIVSIEDVDGKSIMEDKAFPLTKNGNDYVTEATPLGTGAYNITKYLVVSNEKIVYATPRTGAEKASLIDLPLPVAFNVGINAVNNLTPAIIGISPYDTPESFGYTDFGFANGENEQEEWMSVRVKFEHTVGAIYYKNSDAEFIVRGFDANDNPVWNQTYAYIGPQPNDLRIKMGYSKYTIEAKKFAWSLSQTFTGVYLYEHRVKEDTVPVTQVFAYTTEPKRIKSTVSSFEERVNSVLTMVPNSKTVYQYDGNRLSGIDYYTYSRTETTYTLNMKSEFSYENNRVSRITTVLVDNGTLYSEDTYTYDNIGNPTHIRNNSISGITADVDINYSPQNRIIKATYRMSNGTGFEYEFEYEPGSIKSDKTTRAGQLCNTGEYTYDKSINPLKHLGYTDYLFRNYSASNRLSEDVKYTSCSFPSFVPNWYSYVYDDAGYPTLATTVYRGSGSKSQVEYTYVE